MPALLCFGRPRWWMAALLPSLLLTVSLLPAESPGGKKYALLVGINQYRHDKLKPLQYAEADVTDLADVLRKAGYDVTLLTGSAPDAEHLPTKANIEKQLHAVLRRCQNKGDTALLAFAGHGLQFEAKEEKDKPDCYFCPVDARPFRNEIDSLVSLTRVYSELEKSFAGMKVLLVDACRDDPDAGRGTRGIDADVAPRPPQGVAALFSCRAGERAWEHKELGHGVFFYHVLKGLQGEARNSKGRVTFARLAAYVAEEVPTSVHKLVDQSTNQSPNLKADYSTEPVLVGGEDARVEPGRAKAPFDAARARLLQKAWADYLGKKVVETVDLGDGVTMELALIPPGTFMMGSAGGEDGHWDGEGPAHEVELTQPFWIGKYEVTRGQFRRFVEADDYKTEAETDGKGGSGYFADKKVWYYPAGKEYTWRNTGFSQSDEHPVVNVSWNDAVAFCVWTSRKVGGKVRLPTEAEWEYCCRAGTMTRFYSGDEDDSLRRVANIADKSFKAKFDPNSRDKKYQKIISDWIDEVSWDDDYPFTAPVGQFRPNAFDLYDMHGNAWEWCADRYDKYPADRQRNPEGPSAGPYHVYRGGGFLSAPRVCRCAGRAWWVAVPCGFDLGFRVVLLR